MATSACKVLSQLGSHAGRLRTAWEDDWSDPGAVDGQIVAKEVVVTTTSWEDTVFSNNYKLRPLSEVASYIKDNQHLPEVPAANEVVNNGISLAEMNKLLMKKVEELTLYTISLESRITQLETTK